MTAVDFDGMDVESPSGEHLGEVDGFIVDSESGRPYYVVVDAGGWFKSKHFLLPVGHVRFDADAEALKADLTRDRVERFPGFNKDEFDKLTPDDLKKFNDQTLQVCALTAYTYSEAEPYSAAWNRPEFSYPEWWRSGAIGTATGPRRGVSTTGAGTSAAVRSESSIVRPRPRTSGGACRPESPFRRARAAGRRHRHRGRRRADARRRDGGRREQAPRRG